MNNVRNILHPEAYHGRQVRGPFFEGWYVKLVTKDGDGLALIPGVFKGRDPGSEHAFIQLVVPNRPKVDYVRFPIAQFTGLENRFHVEIKNHHFSPQGVDIHLDECKGSVQFSPLRPWPVSLRAPGAMGWYAWVPFMQCYHGVVSLNHRLAGQLSVYGKTYNFNGGYGYIEKDWGRSFPKTWIWMQSNRFSQDNVCISVSLARVPWLGRAFPGLLAGFWHNGNLLKMTSYTGAKVESIERTPTGVRLRLVDKTHRLEVFAHGGQPTAIYMPSETSMDGTVEEHLGAQIYVRLTDTSGQTIFEDTGTQAAYEAHGDISQLD